MEEACNASRKSGRECCSAEPRSSAFAARRSAQNVVKLGMVGEFSGPFAQYGQQILGGMKAYMKHARRHGGRQEDRDRAEGHRPVPRPTSPSAWRRSWSPATTSTSWSGFGLTPNALAVAPVATEAKKAMVIMNAATSIITTKSPYIVRVSMTLPQVTQPMADLGGEERHQEGVHGGRRLRSGARRREGVHRGVQEGRRRDGRQHPHAAAEPGLRRRSSSG